MNKTRAAMIYFLLTSSLIPHPSSLLRADGGEVRVCRDAGPYRVAVFTSPVPLRAGPADVSVLVQDAATGAPLPDASVRVGVVSPGGKGSAPEGPATGAAANRLLRAANVELPAAGRWHLTVTVDDGRGPAQVEVPVDAAGPLPRWRELWVWMAWPVVPVVLFGLHQWLLWREGGVARAAGGVKR